MIKESSILETDVYDKEDKENVKEFLFSELSKMYLHSMCYLYGYEAIYNKEDHKLIDEGKKVLKDVIKVKDKSDGFSIDPSTTDDICFALAWCIENENSYSDCYHQNRESSIEYAFLLS